LFASATTYETVAFEDIDCAPAQADALNEWSSIPPVSRAKQTFGFDAAASDAGAETIPTIEIARVEAAARAVNLTVFFKISSRGSLASEGLSISNLLNFRVKVTMRRRYSLAFISTIG